VDVNVAQLTPPAWSLVQATEALRYMDYGTSRLYDFQALVADDRRELLRMLGGISQANDAGLEHFQGRLAIDLVLGDSLLAAYRRFLTEETGSP
jgi:hypothetical protein